MHRIGDHEVMHLEAYCRTLNMKIAAWLATDEAESVPEAEHLGKLPELFRLATHLVLDTRLSANDRALLLAGVIYVVSPADLIPEGVLGTAGYRDDLVLLALTLHRIARSTPAEVLADSWPHATPLDRVLDAVLSRGEVLVGPSAWQRLQAWVQT